MLDIIFLIIIIGAALWGFTRGLFRVGLSLVGYVIALWGAGRYATTLASWIVANSTWDESLKESINQKMTALLGDQIADMTTGIRMNELGQYEELSHIADFGLQFPSDSMNHFLNESAMGTGNVMGLDFTMLADTLAYYALVGISSVILFFGIKIVLGLVSGLIAHFFVKAKAIGAVDRLMGMVLGVMLGALIVFFAVTAMAPISVALGGTMVESIQESKVIPWVMESTLYQDLLQRIYEGIVEMTQLL